VETLSLMSGTLEDRKPFVHIGKIIMKS